MRWPKSILGPPRAQKSAKDGPREPPNINFDDFWSIFAPFGTGFGIIFDSVRLLFRRMSHLQTWTSTYTNIYKHAFWTFTGAAISPLHGASVSKSKRKNIGKRHRNQWSAEHFCKLRQQWDRTHLLLLFFFFFWLLLWPPGPGGQGLRTKTHWARRREPGIPRKPKEGPNGKPNAKNVKLLK